MQYNENGQCSQVAADRCETRDKLDLVAERVQHKTDRARAVMRDIHRGIDPKIWEGWKLRVCYVVPCIRRQNAAGVWRSMAFGRAVAPHLGYADCQGVTGLAARGDQRFAHVLGLAVV